MNIPEKISSWLKSTEGIISSVAVIILLVSNLGWCVKSDKQADQIADLTNVLAERDSLRKVLTIAQGSNRDLYERHAKLQEEFETRDATLRRFIKEKDGIILGLTETVSELRLENIQLKGEKTSDTTASFISPPNNYYYFEADVSWGQQPTLFVSQLSVWDSLYIAHFRTEDDYYYGAISHVNPHVQFRGGEFSIKRQTTQADATSGFQSFGYRGMWASGRYDLIAKSLETSFGVALEILNVKTSPFIRAFSDEDRIRAGAGIEVRYGGE